MFMMYLFIGMQLGILMSANSLQKDAELKKEPIVQTIEKESK